MAHLTESGGERAFWSDGEVLAAKKRSDACFPNNDVSLFGIDSKPQRPVLNLDHDQKVLKFVLRVFGFVVKSDFGLVVLEKSSLIRFPAILESAEIRPDPFGSAIDLDHSKERINFHPHASFRF